MRDPSRSRNVLDRLIVGGIEPAGRQNVLAQLDLLALAFLGVLPDEAAIGKKAPEKLQPGPMYVGIGHGHGPLVDPDDQDMGIGRADVVLDQEAALVLGRGRAEPRMVELERGGTTQPLHEGLDALAAFFRQVMHPRAIEGLDGSGGLEVVDGLVDVHHDQVEAVTGLAIPDVIAEINAPGIEPCSGSGSANACMRVLKVACCAEGRQSSMVAMLFWMRRSTSGPCGIRKTPGRSLRVPAMTSSSHSSPIWQARRSALSSCRCDWPIRIHRAI